MTEQRNGQQQRPVSVSQGPADTGHRNNHGSQHQHSTGAQPLQNEADRDGEKDIDKLPGAQHHAHVGKAQIEFSGYLRHQRRKARYAQAKHKIQQPATEQHDPFEAVIGHPAPAS